MFKDFFKPAWQNSSAEKRRAAIDNLDAADAAQLEILAELAQRDDDAKVRKLAASKLGDLSVLTQLLTKPASESWARKKLLEKLREITDAGALLDQYPELKPLMLTHVGDRIVREKLQAELSTDDALLSAMLTTPWKDSKRQLAARLSSLDAVDEARKQLKGKDKQAERALKQVHDDLLAEQRAVEVFTEKRDETLSSISSMAESVWTPDYKLKYLALTKNWDTLQGEPQAEGLLTQEHQERWRNALLKAEAILSEGQAIHDAEIAQNAAADKSTALLGQVQRLSEAESREATEYLSEIEALDVAWNTAVDVCEPEVGVRQKYKAAMSPLKAWAAIVAALNEDADTTAENTLATLDALLTKHAAELKLVEDLRQRRQTLHEQLCAQQKRAAKEAAATVDALHKRVGSLFGAIRRGDLRKAKSIHAKLDAKLDGLPDRDRAGLEKRLNDASEKMSEMGDWAEFATAPKYEALCAEMETLRDAEIPPKARAEQIKALQEEWKALGVAPADDALWERFKAAGDEAWKPCAEYFDQRRKQREGNLGKREDIAEEMCALATEHGETPADLDKEASKALQSAFHSLSARWNNFRDVDRNALKPVAERFEQARADVQTVLDRIYDHNRAQKEQLIERASALGAEDASAHQLNQVKQLQAAWKLVGITRREDDDALWQAFREACDLSYSKDREQRDQLRGKEKEAENALRQFAADIKTLSPQDDIKFSELVQNFQKARGESADLHEKALERIDKDFAKATEQFERAQDKARDEKAQSQIEHLRGLASLCERVEGGVSKAEVEEEWNSLLLDDKVLMQRIQQRLDSAADARDDAEAERRMLCVKLEILANIETPEEDKALRMQYQLEQLKNAGIGATSTENAKHLEIEWLCVPGAASATQTALNQRFEKGLSAL